MTPLIMLSAQAHGHLPSEPRARPADAVEVLRGRISSCDAIDVLTQKLHRAKLQLEGEMHDDVRDPASKVQHVATCRLRRCNPAQSGAASPEALKHCKRTGLGLKVPADNLGSNMASPYEVGAKLPLPSRGPCASRPLLPPRHAFGQVGPSAAEGYRGCPGGDRPH